MNTAPGKITEAGHQYLLGLAFLGKQAVEQYWVGLARRPQTPDVTLSALTALEPKAADYHRRPLKAEDFRLESLEVVSKRVVFSNFGNDPWAPVDVSFLATTQDGSGVLLFWGALRAQRVLLPGDEDWFPVRVGLLK